MKIFSIIIPACVCLSLFTYLSNSNAQEKSNQPKGSRKIAEKVAALPSSPILAKVGDTIITVDGYTKEIESLPQDQKSKVGTAEGKTELLDTLVVRELIYQVAQKEQLDNTPAIIDKLKDLKKRLIVEAYLKKKLLVIGAYFKDKVELLVTDGNGERQQELLEKLKNNLKKGTKWTIKEEVLKNIERTSNNAVLAKVNKSIITVEDFTKENEKLPEYLKSMGDTAEGRRDLLDTMIIRELMLQDAAKMGIEKTSALNEQLKYQKKQLVMEAYLLKKVEGQVPDGDVEKYQEVFQKLKDDLKRGGKYTINKRILQDLGGAVSYGAQEPAPVKNARIISQTDENGILHLTQGPPDFYAIMLGPFKNRNYIDKLDKKLKSAGIKNYSLCNYEKNEVAVLFGNYPSESRAALAAKKLVKNKVIGRYEIVGRDNEELTREAEQKAENERKEANKKTSLESIRMEKFLKSARFRNLFEAWCEYTGPSDSIFNNIYCVLDFPRIDPSIKSPFKYQHEIQAIVAGVAGYLAHSETAEDFLIQASGAGAYLPMTSYMHNKYFDRLDAW
jgi:peptidyl-prolyl cis-trans isomerase C